ncbi:tetratricopeptide repeat protein [Desulfonatronum parangueonense]
MYPSTPSRRSALGWLRVRSAMCLALLLWVFLAITATPASGRPTIPHDAHQQLSAAQELLQNQKWTEAEAHLDRFVKEFKDEPYAQALGWQMLGYLFHETGRHGRALEAFDLVLAADGLDAELRQQVLYNSAQLLVQANRPAEAVSRIETWMKQAGPLVPEQRVRVAWIYYGAQRYKAAIEHLEVAIRETGAPEIAWIEMLVAALHHDEQYQALTRWLPRLIARNPQDNRPWLQLAGAYLQLNEQRRAAGVLSAGHYQGVFKTSEDVVRLAQMYVQAGVPHKAGRLLEQAMESGRVPSSVEHQELLANAWLHARETRRAAHVLGRKANGSGDCEIHFRAGRLLMQVEDWGAAKEHLEPAAQGRCGRVRAEALMFLGMAAYHEGRLCQARDAFTQAREIPEQRRQAEFWLEVLRRAG